MLQQQRSQGLRLEEHPVQTVHKSFSESFKEAAEFRGQMLHYNGVNHTRFG
jgi:hypothetical protein